MLVRSVVKKVAQYMADVLEDSRDKVQENLLANGGTIYNRTTPSYFVIHISSVKQLLTWQLNCDSCFLDQLR